MVMLRLVKKLFVLMLALVSVDSNWAQHHTITTFGERSCQIWTEEKRAAALAAPHEFKSMAVVGSRTWLAGYVTGYNENLESNRDLLGMVDLDTIVDWVDTYCSKNPKSTVRLGVHRLFDKLATFKRK